MPGTDWLLGLEDEDRLRAITESFARVVATDDGQVVLRAILDITGVFRSVDDEEDRVRRNLGLILLSWLPQGSESRLYASVLDGEKE